MNNLFSLTYGVLLGIALLLVGCGGGGGGGGNKSSPTPVSSVAISSSVASSVTPSSLPVSSAVPSSSLNSSELSSQASSSNSIPAQVTVRGAVVGDAMVGAELNIALGARTYKATVNDKNQFQITLDIEKASAGQPITAMATGASSNRWIQLAALWPSANQLKSLAGIDGIVDASEFLGVNITPLSTAAYAYVMGTQSPPSSDIERQYAMLTLDAVEKLKRAAYLQRVLDDISTELPGRYMNTLAMMMDNDYVLSRIKVLNIYNDLLLNEIELLINDSNQNVLSTKPLKGKYLLSNNGVYYLVDFNEDGTGFLLTSNSPGGLIYADDAKYREGTFSWVKKGTDIKITLDSPIYYGRASRFISPHCTSDFNDCEVRLTSLLLSIMSDDEFSKVAELTLTVSILKLDSQTSDEEVIGSGMVSLLDRTTFYQPKVEELTGLKWHTGTSSYVFSANGTASQTNHHLKLTNSIQWTLENGFIKLSGQPKFLLPFVPTEYGFSAIELSERSHVAQQPNALQKTMVLRGQDITISSDDWSGRWQRVAGNSFSASFDYYSDGGYRDGFETKAFGSWVATSGSHLSGLAGGSWRMEYDLLAIYGDKRYLRYCYGPDFENFLPSYCLLEPYVIDKTFTGNIFWETWSRPFFQEDGSGREWRFWGHQLYREGEPLRTYERVSFNLLLDRTTNTVLELRSSNLNSIELCEYDAFDSCERGTVYTLTRGIEISVNTAANGEVRYGSNHFPVAASGKGSFLVPRQKMITLELIPQIGYTINAGNISGCDGTLSGQFYSIPARQTDCAITMKFIR